MSTSDSGVKKGKKTTRPMKKSDAKNQHSPSDVEVAQLIASIQAPEETQSTANDSTSPSEPQAEYSAQLPIGTKLIDSGLAKNWYEKGNNVAILTKLRYPTAYPPFISANIAYPTKLSKEDRPKLCVDSIAFKKGYSLEIVVSSGGSKLSAEMMKNKGFMILWCAFISPTTD